MRVPFILLAALYLAPCLPAAWIPQAAPAALSPSAQAEDLSGTLKAAQALWSLSYTHPVLDDDKNIRLYAVQALELARKAVALDPKSPSAQIALAECGIRAAYVGGFQIGIAAGAQALRALMAARKLGADPADLERVQARRQLYLAGAFGGDVPKAAAYYEAAHAKDPEGGWNAYFCGEAWRQLKKKEQAKAWYLAAEAAGHKTAAAARSRLKLD
jgi:hypothetical protein